jgi:CDP-diacylglycerol--serine O-phosphatidyltransferase
MTAKPRPRTWTPYLLPNVLTSLNLMAGFYAITLVLNRNFALAVWFLLIAVIMDGLDGMAARLTRGSSAFGLEFDSMADLISFGAAPALLIYLWQLKHYGRIGWVAAFLFLACGSLRLARFNVQSGDVQKYHFLGIPIPMAASQVVTTYLMISHLELSPRTQGLVVITIAYLTAFLMISNFPYRSLKALRVRRQRHAFYVPVLFILTAAVIWIYPQVILWALSTGYIISGPAEAFIRKFTPLGAKIPEGGPQPLPVKPKTDLDGHE